MSQSRSIHDKGPSGSSTVSIDQEKLPEDSQSKDERGRNHACQKLSQHQQFPAHGREEMIVQGLFDDFSSKEPGKNSQAADKDPHMQVIDREYMRHHARAFLNVVPASGRVFDHHQEQDSGGGKGHQINPDAAPLQKRSEER